MIFIHGFKGSLKSYIKDDGKKPLVDSILKEKLIKKNIHYTFFTYDTGVINNDKRKRNIIMNYIKPHRKGKVLSIVNLAKILSTKIENDLNNYKNILLIGHSMGGLIAKQYIIDQKLQRVFNRVIMYASLATPHLGSDLAKNSEQYFNNDQIKDLGLLSDTIDSQNQHWTTIADLPPRFYFVAHNDQVVKIGAIAYDREKPQAIHTTHNHFNILLPNEKKNDVVKPLQNCILHSLRMKFESFEVSSNKFNLLGLLNYYNLICENEVILIISKSIDADTSMSIKSGIESISKIEQYCHLSKFEYISNQIDNINFSNKNVLYVSDNDKQKIIIDYIENKCIAQKSKLFKVSYAK